MNPFRELFESVIPKDDRDETLTIRFSKQYRAYYYEENGKTIAFVTLGWLPKNKVWMIDAYALDPSIRGQGRARGLWSKFVEDVSTMWPEVKDGKDRWLLEAYLKNVQPWSKILNMREASVDMPALHLNSPIKLLEHNVENPKDAYEEWQNFQKMW